MYVEIARFLLDHPEVTRPEGRNMFRVLAEYGNLTAENLPEINTQDIQQIIDLKQEAINTLRQHTGPFIERECAKNQQSIDDYRQMISEHNTLRAVGITLELIEAWENFKTQYDEDCLMIDLKQIKKIINGSRVRPK